MNEMILIPPPKPVAKSRPGLHQTGSQSSRLEDIGLLPPEDIRAPAGGRGRSMDWKMFTAPAAALVLVFGIGWSVAARIHDATRGPDPDQIAAQAAATFAAKSAAAVLSATQTQQREIADLRGHVENLKGKLDAQAQKSHAAESTLAALQKSLAEQRAADAATASKLQAKLEKMQTLAAQRVIDRAPVASISRDLSNEPPRSNLQAPAPKAASVHVPAGAYRAYVLRDVEDGRAVVEGPEGLVEVGPGETLPGGARVEKIERRGRDWVVLTDRGAINPDGHWDD